MTEPVLHRAFSVSLQVLNEGSTTLSKSRELVIYPQCKYSTPLLRHPLQHSPQTWPVSKVQQVRVLRTSHSIPSIHQDAITTYHIIKNTQPYIGQQSEETQSKCGLCNYQMFWAYGKILGKYLSILKIFSWKKMPHCNPFKHILILIRTSALGGTLLAE